LNEYAIIASKDKTWSFHNLFQGVKLITVNEPSEVNALQFHPDGVMALAGLKNGMIKIYDIRSL
jgi:WD40 repeat protein